MKSKVTAKDLLLQLSNKTSKKETTISKDSKVPVNQPPAKLAKIDHGKVVNYYVEYEDGTAQLAQGKEAHNIFRFTMEAQKLATMHAFAYYEGPGMTEMSKQEALDKITNLKGE